MYKLLRSTLLLLFLSTIAIAQDTKIIKLRQQPSDFQPQNFHITYVVDDREDTTTIGTMHKGFANKLTAIDLKDGAAVALAQYIGNNITQDKSTLPIVLHIKDLTISEDRGNYKEQLNLSLALGYYQGDNMLIEYSGTAYIQTGIDASMYIDRIIRQNVASNMKEFDKWLGRNKEQVNAEATIKVNVSFATSASDTNMILYSKTPLTLQDFTGTPDDLSLGVAATFSGINMQYEIRTLGLSTTVNVKETVYFHKNKSWVKGNGYNTRVLSHEQLHFDITALKACQLAEKIRNFNFSAGNYSEELSNLLQEANQEAEDLQRRYDKETEHGTLLDNQEEWQKSIAEQLAQQSCY